MKLISVNVGLPREIDVSGKTVQTSIWKNPVQGRVHVSTLNLYGDQQSDLTVHGGVDKAVYVYPSEHYAYWRGELPEVELPWGAFGENFSAEAGSDQDWRSPSGWLSRVHRHAAANAVLQAWDPI
jgi:MOSC domain-containing protein YiiM